MGLPVQEVVEKRIRAIEPEVVPAEERERLARMLRDDARRRRDAANERDALAWAGVRSRGGWEELVRPRIEALRKSLGISPPPRASLNARVTRTVKGDGYCIENVVYESRPGLLVTANCYLPSAPTEKMPAIVLIHSHHNPKTQRELQDMGMFWARLGCAVLVMDQLGYGERRQIPEGPRQEYRFRYVTGMQLYVIGDSLMGWMVWDVLRGIDLLLDRPEIDAERVILIGAVAGGGDPAAVAAALDPRIRCVIPFNFGGPQPETVYPLPAGAEQSFNYMGGGSWESTRNLRLSGRDGFLPWVIVASVAPRPLIYAHEFSWDQERDPVWKRLQRVFGLCGAAENLAFVLGAGAVTGRPPEATHCNNVGAVHRRMIYPALQKWFGIPIPEAERQERLPTEDLLCFGAESTGGPEAGASALSPLRPLYALLREIGASRAAAMRATIESLGPEAGRERLREEWARLLGDIAPAADPVVTSQEVRREDGLGIERLVMEVEPGIVVPALLLVPAGVGRRAVVIPLSQEGKSTFLRERAREIANLLASGIAVCLPDVRGTGETQPGGGRGRQSAATAVSATELMLGQTLLGSRLRDLRSVLRYLRMRGDVDEERLALWGDSFTPVNAAGFVDPPIDDGEPPQQCEPLGGLLALFGALFEPGVRAVAAGGLLAGYEAVLGDRFCYVPHDVIVPGALTAGDLCDVAAALAPRPLRLERLVDGRNCEMEASEVRRVFAPAVRAYEGAGGDLALPAGGGSRIGGWLARAVKDGDDADQEIGSTHGRRLA